MLRVVCVVLVLFVAETSAEIYPWRAGFTDGEVGASVAQIEAQQGLWSPRLYEALKTQGQRQYAQAEWPGAIDTFQRMQTLVHRYEGVYSPLQFEAQQLLLQVHEAMGNFRAQQQQQQLMFRIAEHAYSEDDLAMHQARWRLAQWYHDSGRLRDARRLLDDSLRLLQANDSRPNAVAVANRIMAKNQFLSGSCCASVILEQVALSLADRVDADTARTLQQQLDNLRFLEGKVSAQAELQASANLPAKYLGYGHRSVVLQGNEPPFASMGRRTVIRPLDSDSALLKLPSAVGWPVAVCTHTLLDEVSPGDLASMEVQVDLIVQPGGNAGDVSVSGAAPNRLKYYVKKALALGKYRPAISADGEQVSRKLSFTQRFDQQGNIGASMIVAWSRQLTLQACQSQLDQQVAQL